MATAARRAFDENCRDIKLLFSFDPVGPKGGKSIERTEVLNKSAVVLITAFWEAYCEDLAAEAIDHLVRHASTPEELSKQLRKLVADELKSARNELAVWKLAGDGWREVLTRRLEEMRVERNRGLNTPKTVNINDFFEKAVGIQKISDAWHWQGMTAEQAARKLDRYVTLRGDIAHRGVASKSISRRTATNFLDHATTLVKKTGGRVNSVMKERTGVGIW